jgi:hypothetical protein
VDALRRALELGAAQARQREAVAVDLGAHAPRVRRQQRDAVAHHQRLFDRVRDEQQREAHLVPQREQLLLHLAARERVERGEGLVHQQHARLHGERAGNGHALLHAAGELVRMHVGEPGQADLVEVVQRALGGLLPPSVREASSGNMTFCFTVFHGGSWSNSWNTTMRSGPGCVTRRPSRRISPSTGGMNPPTAFSSVDLPQPEGPSSTKRSAACTSKLTRCVARTTRSGVR